MGSDPQRPASVSARLNLKGPTASQNIASSCGISKTLGTVDTGWRLKCVAFYDLVVT